MNSTKKKRGESPQAFFEKHLLKMAVETQRHQDRYFTRRPDPSTESYYIRREQTAMERKEFEVLDYSDAAALTGRLQSLWCDPQDLELAELAAEFAGFAERLAAVQNEESAEVSPFMYVMF